jgi:flagellar biosynthesis anti-sigma factor FlgM
VLFARAEGIVPAPEANHAVKGAIVEALRCKAEGKSESAALEGDRVEIAGGGSAAIAKSAARNVSDVDEAKVAELRSALARGEYRADMRVVAERVINEALVFGKG